MECNITNYVAYAAMISAAVALASAVLGPTISWCIAKKQINATVLSGNRQNWINSVRNEVSELVATISMTDALYKTNNLDKIGSEKAQHLLKDIITRKIKMVLLLNPQEKDHEHLITLIETAISGISHQSASANTTSEIKQMDAILVATNKILKDVWEKVKAGK